MSDFHKCKVCGSDKIEEAKEERPDLEHTVFYVRCLRCLIRTSGAFNHTDANKQWNSLMKENE